MEDETEGVAGLKAAETAQEPVVQKRPASPSNQEDRDVTEESKEAPVLSKREMKKLKRKAKFEEQKAKRRLKDKEKNREKIRNMKATTGISNKERRKWLSASKERSVDINIIFDMSFVECMNTAERAKLVKQIARCYSVNRASNTPLKMHLSGIEGEMELAMNAGQPGYSNWQIHTISPLHFFDCFKAQIEAGDVTYLAAESECSLSQLEFSKYYVIGGLVDHNSRKGLCYRLAQERGLPTGRLPIDEHIKMDSRRVLAVSHVFEILLAFQETGSWQEALISVIPQRKGAQLGDAQHWDQNDDSETENNSIPEDICSGSLNSPSDGGTVIETNSDYKETK